MMNVVWEIQILDASIRPAVWVAPLAIDGANTATGYRSIKNEFADRAECVRIAVEKYLGKFDGVAVRIIHRSPV